MAQRGSDKDLPRQKTGGEPDDSQSLEVFLQEGQRLGRARKNVHAGDQWEGNAPSMGTGGWPFVVGPLFCLLQSPGGNAVFRNVLGRGLGGGALIAQKRRRRGNGRWTLGLKLRQFVPECRNIRLGHGFDAFQFLPFLSESL